MNTKAVKLHIPLDKTQTASRVFKTEGASRAVIDHGKERYVVWGPLSFELDNDSTYITYFKANIGDGNRPSKPVIGKDAELFGGSIVCLEFEEMDDTDKMHTFFDFTPCPEDSRIERGNKDTSLVRFKTNYDDNIEVIISLCTKTPTELEMLLAFFGNPNKKQKRNTTMPAARQRQNTAETATETTIPSPVPAPTLPPLAGTVTEVPPLPTNEELTTVDVTQEAPVAPTTPTIPDPVAKAPEPTPEPTPEPEPTEEQGEDTTPDPNPEPQVEKAPVTYYRAKAPLKGEINSATKLEEKGWTCVPHAWENISLEEATQALKELRAAEEAYQHVVLYIAARGTVSEADKEVYREEGRQDIRKKMSQI